jgi:hypothetical protein
MTYIKPSTRKVNRQKPPLVETVSNKRYWVILTDKGKIASKDGQLLIFYRRKDAQLFEEDICFENRCDGEAANTRKIEKLDVLVTR